MIRDYNINWLRQIRRIPAQAFVGDAVVAGTATTAAFLVGYDDGAPQLLEVSTFGYGGISIAAAGDSVSHLDMVHPSQWDPRQQIGVRVIWTTNGAVATTDSVTWVVTYDQADEGEALAAATTALNTTIAAQSPAATTTLIPKRTSRGIINADTFDFTSRIGFITWNVEADVLSGFSADEVVFLGLEIDFIPLLCVNSEEDLDVFSSRAAGG